jgi:DNA-binding response OmpR family regulator
MEKKSILIVDDAAALRFVLSFDLEKKGFRTIVAGNGEKGFELAKEKKPDLILMDVVMKTENEGFDTLQKLKSDESTRSIPVILVTARSDKEDIQKGLSMGASGYVTKPFGFAELMARMTEIIGK